MAHPRTEMHATNCNPCENRVWIFHHNSRQQEEVLRKGRRIEVEGTGSISGKDSHAGQIRAGTRPARQTLAARDQAEPILVEWEFMAVVSEK